MIPDGQAVPYPPGTQYLQAEVNGRTARCGWAGPWPPPTEMLFYVGLTTSTWLEMPENFQQADRIQSLVDNGGALYRLRRLACSELPDEVILAEDSRVMRGAAYGVIGPW